MYRSFLLLPLLSLPLYSWGAAPDSGAGHLEAPPSPTVEENHQHPPPDELQLIANSPPGGYCGNTLTQVRPFNAALGGDAQAGLTAEQVEAIRDIPAATACNRKRTRPRLVLFCGYPKRPSAPYISGRRSRNVPQLRRSSRIPFRSNVCVRTQAFSRSACSTSAPVSSAMKDEP